MINIALIALLLCMVPLVHTKRIYDPYMVFCGPQDCYDILDIPSKTNNITIIKQAYRKLSKKYHPDKVKEKDKTIAKEYMLKLNKAHEVLRNETAKNLFDYYLDNPTHYYKVSGHYYLPELPKASPMLVLLLVLVFVSALLYYNQNKKHHAFLKQLEDYSSRKLGPKSVPSGTQRTLDIHNRAYEVYKTDCREKKQNIVTNIEILITNPVFMEAIRNEVSKVKLGHFVAKPKRNDFFLIWIFVAIYNYFLKKSLELSDEAKARDAVNGRLESFQYYDYWEDLSTADRNYCIEQKVWLPENRHIIGVDIEGYDEYYDSGYHGKWKKIIVVQKETKKGK